MFGWIKILIKAVSHVVFEVYLLHTLLISQFVTSGSIKDQFSLSTSCLLACILLACWLFILLIKHILLLDSA